MILPHSTNSTSKESLIREALATAGHLPRISLVMPVYNPPYPYFERAVQSAVAQWHADWELCIADDASPEPDVRKRIEAIAASDPRIHTTYRRENGHISKATNSAASLASGEFLAFLDQDDAVTPDCLARLALYIAGHPETDIVYSDDDKIDEADVPFAPQYKQDYDPAQMFSFMQFGHIFCVRRSVFEALGGFRPGFEGSQDYDFALRAMERARHIGHVPEILYHWRSLPGSTAASGDEKPYSFASGVKAVQQSLDRRGTHGTAIHPGWARQAGCGLYGVEFPIADDPVTVLMPYENQGALPLDSLRAIARTDHADIRFAFVLPADVTLPALPSDLFPAGVSVMQSAVPQGRAAALRNDAVRRVQTPWVALLNPDLVPRSPAWLSQSIGYAKLLGAGCAGGTIVDQDGRIIHAGYLHGLERMHLPGRAHHGEPDSWGHHFRLVTPSSCSAVSEACLVTGTQDFTALGGFDEKRFPDCLYAEDYCYRLRERGKRTLLCPEARFTLHGGAARGAAHGDALALFGIRHAAQPRAVNPHIAEGCDFTTRPYAKPEPLHRPLRMLMVTHGLAPEGAPRTLLDLGIGLDARGKAAPTIWSHVDGPLRDTCKAGNISLRVLEDLGKKHAAPQGDTDLNRYVAANLSFLDMRSERAFDAAISRLSETMSQDRPEVVLANTILAFWAVLAANRAGIPCLWVIRESEEPLLHLSALPDFVQNAARRCFAMPYRVIFVAEATRRIFCSFDTMHNFTVIRNALDFSAYPAGSDSRQEWRARLAAQYGFDWPDDAPVALMLGSVFERKGQTDFVQAWASLPDDVFYRARYCIVGDRPGTPYSDAIHRMAETLPPERRCCVAIVPETPDPLPFYRAADIFVCCSRIESFPRVILEAMHYDLAIVTTPVFGIAEQVRDNLSALYYEPGDIAALNRVLTQLIHKPDLRARLRSGAKEALAALPDYDTMLSAYAELLHEASYTT